MLVVGRTSPRKPTASFFKGDLDDLALFSAPLTHRQIIQHFLAAMYEVRLPRPEP